MSHLPPNIAVFFQSRPPLAQSKAPESTTEPPSYGGVGEFLHYFKESRPEPEVQPTPQQLKAEKQAKLTAVAARKLMGRKVNWDVKKRPAEEMTEDSYKTLFVGRLAYELSAEDIKSEFEYYGPVKQVKLVLDKKTGKSRGYAFVEFERSKDFKHAYDDADNRKLAGRRIVVDVERGRTVTGWLPRKLGGGLGATRLGGKDVSIPANGRFISLGGSSSGSSSSYSSYPSSSSSSSRSYFGSSSNSRRSRSPPPRHVSRSRDDRSYRRSSRDRSRDRGYAGGSSGGSSSSSSRRRERSRSRSPRRGSDRSRDRDRDRGRSRSRDRARPSRYEDDRYRRR